MVNVSKKYLLRGLKQKAWEIFLDEFKRTQTAQELEKIMAGWLSEKEMIALEKRLAIKVLVEAGTRHNEIKRILDVSSHTITSVKKKLNSK